MRKNCKIGENGCLGSGCVRLRSGAEAFVAVADEVRDGDRHQDANGGNDDHELDQGETFIVCFNLQRLNVFDNLLFNQFLEIQRVCFHRLEDFIGRYVYLDELPVLL